MKRMPTIFILLMLTLFISHLSASGRSEDEPYVQAEGTESWSYEYDISGAVDGKYNFIVRGKDSAGNTAYAGPYNVFVDNDSDLPVVSIAHPNPDVIVTGNFNIVGSALDDDGISRVEINLDGGPYTECKGTDFWDFYLDVSEIPDGSHIISVRATDINGVAGPEKSVPFLVDKSAPVTTILSHETGVYLSDTAIITGSVQDASGIEKLFVQEKDRTGTRELKLKYDKNNDIYTFKHTLSTADFTDGPHDLQFRSIDRSGSEGITSLLFFADNTEPQIEVLHPEQGASVNEKILLSGILRDEVGIKKLSYTIDKAEYEIELIPGNPYWVSELDLSSFPYGKISVTFTAEDFTGNSTSKTLKLRNSEESEKPTVGVFVPDRTGTEESVVQAAITACDDDMVAGIEYSVDDGETETIQARGPALIKLDSLEPGKHTIRARAIDTGDRYGDFVSRSFVVPKNSEKEPLSPVPELFIDQDLPLAVTTDELNITGRIDGSLAALELVHRIMGDPSEEWSAARLDSAGSVDLKIPVDMLSDGQYVLEIQVRSESGNFSSNLIPFTLETKGPEIRILTPAADDEVNGKISLSGIAKDTCPIENIEFSDDGENFQEISTGPYFQYTIDLSTYETTPVEIFLRATDSSGLTSTQTMDLNISRLNDIPISDIQFPSDGMTFSADFTATGTALDDDGIAFNHYSIDDEEWKKIEGDSTFTIPVRINTLEDGEHFIRVKSEDYNGLMSTIVENSFHISRTDPLIRITSPNPDEYVEGIYTIGGTAQDPNGMEAVFVSLDNGSTYNRAEGTDTWEYKLDADMLTDGSYSLYVRGVDTGGNDSYYTTLLNIDNTGPAINLDTPSRNSGIKNVLHLSGRVTDNIEVGKLKMTLLPLENNSENSAGSIEQELDPEERLEHSIDISTLPPGWYNFNIEASDTAGNISYMTRNIRILEQDTSRQIRILFPLEGSEEQVFSRIEGSVDSESNITSVVIKIDGSVISTAEVQGNKYFSVLFDSTQLSPGDHVLEAQAANLDDSYTSLPRRFTFRADGPWIIFESHTTGESLTQRSFIEGKTGYAAGEDEIPELERIEISYDDGKNFEIIDGKKILSKKNKGNWKVRIETQEFPDGPLPVLASAVYADGSSASAKLLLDIDKTPPDIHIESPAEGQSFNEVIGTSGTAGDKNGLREVSVLLRKGDKNRYEVPSFVQGLYLDLHTLGATYAEIGMGLSFFDDNVKLQGLVGAAPPGRFTGLTLGGKLLANVATIPYYLLFGPDWQNMSMAFALGANFSYFTMTEDNYSFTTDGVILGSILGQWEFLRYTAPENTSFHTYSLYTEGSLWFISSDVEAGLVPRLSFGMRIGVL